MTVRVKIREYLEQLETEEAKKPPQKRKPIPKQADIAQAAGTPKQTISSFLRRKKHKRLDLDLVDSIITQLRTYGHDTDVSDLIEYVED